MSGKKSQAILDPRIGMLIVEDDPRGDTIKRIIGLDDAYVYTGGGITGIGRRSRILRRRLKEGRYRLVYPR